MRTKERKKSLGEVFTPPELVEEILNQLPPEVWQDTTKTFLDNSCGSGNFLVAVLERLLQTDADPLNALARVHGVDIMQDNVDECRQRLKQKMFDALTNSKPFTVNELQVNEILERNIVCADGLRYHYRFDGTPPYDIEVIEPKPIGEDLFDFGS
jgi:type I restriction-modification system DNA methylase subunit